MSELRFGGDWDWKAAGLPFSAKYIPLAEVMATAALTSTRDLTGEEREALRLLTDWATLMIARVKSVKLGNSNHERKGDDHDLLRRALYVEDTAWFANTKPILTHIHVRGLSIDSYRIWDQHSGVPYSLELQHHGMEADWRGKTQDLIVLACYGRFIDVMLNRLAADPLPTVVEVKEVELADMLRIDEQLVLRSCWNCAKAAGAKWRNSATATAQEGECVICGRLRAVAPVTSWDWRNATVKVKC
jgi:hypothetical protein